MSNFLVVLFKNRKKKKIIKKFITFKKAKELFEKCRIASEETLFPLEIENTTQVKYELAIVEIFGKKTSPTYLVDEYGRNLRVKLDDETMTICEIVNYKMEEKFFDFQKKSKIDTQFFFKKYLSVDGLKMISSLNNKVILQNDDKFYLFSFKNTSETNRFIDFLTYHMISIKRKDCLIIKDSSKAQKKYLYKILEEKGFEKKYLYRSETTYRKIHQE